MLKYVETKNAPAAIGPYSQGIICNGIAFFSGQIPLSPGAKLYFCSQTEIQERYEELQ